MATTTVRISTLWSPDQKFGFWASEISKNQNPRDPATPLMGMFRAMSHASFDFNTIFKVLENIGDFKKNNKFIFIVDRTFFQNADSEFKNLGLSDLDYTTLRNLKLLPEEITWEIWDEPPVMILDTCTS